MNLDDQEGGKAMCLRAYPLRTRKKLKKKVVGVDFRKREKKRSCPIFLPFASMAFKKETP